MCINSFTLILLIFNYKIAKIELIATKKDGVV